MPGIEVLPPALQNQIAAGEVVERPSSVVKELMENSLDARAATVQVRISEGGQSLVQVKDDGTGMTPEEIPLALTRHATSKLYTLQDLNSLISFGFRGEALPSIASVSRLRLCSITSEAEEGFCAEVDQGRLVEQWPVALDKGTSVAVHNLLANVPARLKFLKTSATEHKKCQEVFYRLALAHPEVDFEFFVQDKSVKRFFCGQEILTRLKEIWPRKVTAGLQEIELAESCGEVWGLTGSPDTAQGRADRIYFYVNNRPVSDRMLLSALRSAYKGSLLSREYPQAIIFLRLPPEEVDVNTHPTKNEVRFHNESEVFTLVKRAVQQIFSQGKEKSLSYPEQKPESSTRATEKTINLIQEPADKQYFSDTPTAFRTEPETGSSQVPTSPEKTRVPGGFQYMGQIFATYLLLYNTKEFILLDQHAVHERILYERVRQKQEKARQKTLLLPLEIFLGEAEQTVLAEIRTELEEMGFGFKTGEKTLVLNAVPEWLSPEKGKEYVQDILSDRTPDKERVWITFSCRSAIKAGQQLTNDEALALIQQWFQCPNKDFCPHGRPVASVWEESSLEKLFKRGK